MLHRTGLWTEAQVRGSKSYLGPVPLSTNQFYEAYDHVLDIQGSVCLFTTSGAPSGESLKWQKEPVEILNCVITPHGNSKNKYRSIYMVDVVII